MMTNKTADEMMLDILTQAAIYSNKAAKAATRQSEYELNGEKHAANAYKRSAIEYQNKMFALADMYGAFAKLEFGDVYELIIERVCELKRMGVIE